jgi:hypothetical protein
MVVMAHLVSVDMSYPIMNYEPWVGIVVPERMRANWEIVREPDRRGLEKAIARFDWQDRPLPLRLGEILLGTEFEA